MTAPGLTYAQPTTPQTGPIVITEIMYNPASPEGGWQRDDGTTVDSKTEWVEIHNPTDAAVDLAGYRLADEDGQTGPFPPGTTLEPGATAVVIPIECTTPVFHAAWGGDIQTIEVTDWSWTGIQNLANSPSASNEVLTLRDAAGQVVDEVNFDDESPWPTDSPHGPSIYLLPGHLTPAANDAPAAWTRSTLGTHDARLCTPTRVFNGQDIGSPGTVPATESFKPVMESE
ncbi:MAG: lamin tail domain-containing protein [Planctomycetota bacterium]